jgi:site-specific DNA recombinase
VVVVYKVDRLTRSLADFAKMVQIFDAQGVSFVGVTQQFNTTTSMGLSSAKTQRSSCSAGQEGRGARRARNALHERAEHPQGAQPAFS